MNKRDLAKLSIGLVILMCHGIAACSSDGQADAEIQPQEILKNIPDVDNEVAKYILTIAVGKGQDDLNSNQETVVLALKKGGAIEIDALEGLPIIMVTGRREAIDNAMKSGLIETVQSDSLRKPYQ